MKRKNKGFNVGPKKQGLEYRPKVQQNKESTSGVIKNPFKVFQPVGILTEKQNIDEVVVKAPMVNDKRKGKLVNETAIPRDTDGFVEDVDDEDSDADPVLNATAKLMNDTTNKGASTLINKGFND